MADSPDREASARVPFDYARACRDARDAAATSRGCMDAALGERCGLGPALGERCGLLGHSSPVISLQIYTHLQGSQTSDAIAFLDAKKDAVIRIEDEETDATEDLAS